MPRICVLQSDKEHRLQPPRILPRNKPPHAAQVGITEERPENYIIHALVDYDDISYDEHADLIYDLAGQVA